jgi:hypothetical protein
MKNGGYIWQGGIKSMDNNFKEQTKLPASYPLKSILILQAFQRQFFFNDQNSNLFRNKIFFQCLNMYKRFTSVVWNFCF